MGSKDGCSGLPGEALHSILLSHVGMCSLARASQADNSQGEVQGSSFCIQSIQRKQGASMCIANEARLPRLGELLKALGKSSNKELLQRGRGKMKTPRFEM